MNKLISRNPVQRFKQGRKIIKASKGWNGTFAGVLPSGKVKLRDVPGITEEYGTQWENVMTQDQINQLLNTGYFDRDQSFFSVTAFQNALKNFLANEGWEKGQGLKIDGMWGDQTQKAFELALSKAGYDPSNKTGLTPTTLSNIYNQNKLEGLYAAGLLKKPESLTVPENKLPTINTKIRGGNFNKSQIRDLIRKGGFNPYAYTGAQRKALRLYLNGLSNDTSLLDGTDLARFTLPFRKKGGILPSRNIIKRFKNRKFN